MLKMLLSGKGRLITHAVGWTLATVGTYYLLATLRSPQEAVGRTALFVLFPMLLFYTNARILTNRFFEKGKYGQWAVLAILLWFGLAAIRVWLELKIYGGNVLDAQLKAGTNGMQMFLVTVLIYFILMIFSGLYQLLENRRELDSRHAEAQLNFLKAQINPHFLFNTLNNIYAAATLGNPKTPDMVLRLSDLLRYVTYEGQRSKVPLEREMAQIRAYIDLFQLRSEQALPISITEMGNTAATEIEPLILMPLVENALKHGDLDYNPEGFLNISLNCEGRMIRFRVENSFDPENQQKDSQGGVGLENIRQRLDLAYPGKHRILINRLGRLFDIEVEIEMV